MNEQRQQDDERMWGESPVKKLLRHFYAGGDPSEWASGVLPGAREREEDRRELGGEGG